MRKGTKMRPYTQEELDTLLAMRADRYSFKEIAKELGRDESALREKHRLLVANGAHKRFESTAGPFRRTLKDFTPEEMISHLYGLGYRVEGRLYVVKKEYVSIPGQELN